MKVRVCALAAVFAGLLTLVGCGGHAAKVRGRVTCDGKPLAGHVQFSPKGEGPDNTGTAITAESKADGTYEIVLKTIGKHTVVITPNDIKYPVPPGEFSHPCDRSPQEFEVKAADNTINVELSLRK